MAHKYFLTGLSPDACQVYATGDEAHHLATVMRVKRGATLTLCDGAGMDYSATVETVERDAVLLAINSCTPSESEPTVRVMLYVGYPKQDKLEWIIQKAIELGAVEIVPFFSQFCVAAPKNEEQKNIRYNKIALEAAKQSGRGIVPTVAMPLSYREMLHRAAQADAALFCYENERDAPSLHSRLGGGVSTVAIITGSEGGFSAQEAQQAVEAGCVSVGLGPRILRCETAPLAALAAVMTLTGNLQ